MKRALSPCSSNSSSTSSSSTGRGESRSPKWDHPDSSAPISKRLRLDRSESPRLRRSASRHSSTSSRSSSSRSYEAHPSPRNDRPEGKAVHKRPERHRSGERDKERCKSRVKGSSDNSDGGKMPVNGAAGHSSTAAVFDVEKVPYASESLETLKPMIMADAIKMLTEKKYDELTRNRYDQPNTYSKDRIRKVLASVIMKRKCSRSNDRLCIVSLGAGSKSISGAHLTKKGDKIHDCHAEVLARRGLVRFLYSQLEEIKNGNHTISIFENEDNNPYTLRKGVSFHLFISKPPCGDASVFGLHENHQNRKRRGIARVTPADGEGAIHISWPPEQDKTFEDYTSRCDRGRLHKMCCSAKIARWNVTGVQGALLSLYIEPVYFSSITIGSQFNDGHLRRAVYNRVSKIQGLPFPYHVNDPNLYHVSSPDDTMEKSHKMSLNWHLQQDLENDVQMEQQSPNSQNRSRGEELIECQYGKPPGSSHGTSRLSKKELLKCFISLWDSLAPSTIKQRLSRVHVQQQPYSAVKALAESYQETKARVADCFAGMPYGSRWLKMPPEVGHFSLLDLKEQNDSDS